MSLAELAEAGAPQSRPRFQCALDRMETEMPPAEFDALVSMIANREWPLTQVLLATKGEYPDIHVPDYSSLHRHRTGRCSCGRGVAQ